MRHKVLSLALVIWLALFAAVPVMAEDFDSGRKGSVSVTLLEQDGETPVAGVELSLYYVATVARNSRGDLGYVYTAEFKNCGAALNDPDLAAKLDAFVSANTLSPRKLITDAEGKVTFAELPLGLYFVRQSNSVAGHAPCKSFLLTLPGESADGYVYDVNASPKTEVERLTDITIKKVWNSDKYTPISGSVTVQLLLDGKVVQIATLDPTNNWQVTYEDMPVSDGYSIVEVDVPKDFTATYFQKEYVFTVTNSSTLIQTGQLIWPIPVLALAGLALITVGAVLLKKSGKKHA